jgi:bacteriocin-like protein
MTKETERTLRELSEKELEHVAGGNFGGPQGGGPGNSGPGDKNSPVEGPPKHP